MQICGWWNLGRPADYTCSNKLHMLRVEQLREQAATGRAAPVIGPVTPLSVTLPT